MPRLFSLVIDGRDISKRVEPRLVQLDVDREPGDEADQLDLTIDDSDGRMNLGQPRGPSCCWAWAGMAAR